MGQQLKHKFSLEKQCDLRRIGEYLEEREKTTQKTSHYNDQFHRKEFVVMGRSNVGKSSLINQLVDQPLAYTSK